MLRRARGLSILAILAAGAVLLITSTQTWLMATLRESPDIPLAVAGAVAVPVLTPLSLAALALGAALSLAGRAMAVISGVLAAVLGALLAALALPLTASPPVSAVAGSVTEATGIAGEGAVAGLVRTIAPTVWPWIAVAAAAALAIAGVLTLLSAPTWRSTGRRYRTDSVRDAAPPDQRAGGAGGSPAPGNGVLDAIDSWDDLSHGSDPTR